MRVDGPTPAGGAYAEVVLLDADGNEVDDPQQATHGEATEYTSDGQMISRTYLVADGTTPPPPPAHDDALDAALAAPPGPWDPAIATFDDLWAMLGAESIPFATAREKIALITALPGWVNAPKALSDEVDAWLVVTRPTA
jgi:hypothetical protein